MKAYIVHNINGNEELQADLETTRSEATVARKLVENSVYLLRKVDEKKKVSQVEARWLVEEKVAMAAKKEKAEEEIARLRWELQDLRARFAAQKKDHHKQVNDMFFQGYRYCMKKHGITNNAPNFPSDDEEDELLGGLT